LLDIHFQNQIFAECSDPIQFEHFFVVVVFRRCSSIGRSIKNQNHIHIHTTVKQGDDVKDFRDDRIINDVSSRRMYGTVKP
jgi:hypothetical protein